MSRRKKPIPSILCMFIFLYVFLMKTKQFCIKYTFIQNTRNQCINNVKIHNCDVIYLYRECEIQYFRYCMSDRKDWPVIIFLMETKLTKKRFFFLKKYIHKYIHTHTYITIGEVDRGCEVILPRQLHRHAHCCGPTPY